MYLGGTIMKEYANIINESIEAINRSKFEDCHQELTALFEVALSAMKFNLYATIGIKAAPYFSGMDDLLREFRKRNIEVPALIHQLYDYVGNVCSSENISKDRFDTTINYIKMMTDIEW